MGVVGRLGRFVVGRNRGAWGSGMLRMLILMGMRESSMVDDVTRIGREVDERSKGRGRSVEVA